MSKEKNKFIIYKATGGMTHMLYNLAFTMFVAEKQKRILVIDTTKGDGSIRNKFTLFFKLLSEEITYSDDFSVLPDDISWFGLNKKELEGRKPYEKKIDDPWEIVKRKNTKVEVYGGAITAFFYLRILPHLMQIKLNEIYFKKIKSKIIPISGKYIGVHFRNTDRKNEIQKFIHKIKIVSRKKGIKKIYLATDDYKAKNKFEAQLPGLEIIAYTKPYDFKDFREKGTFHEGLPTHYFNPNAEEQTDGYFIDFYMLLKSTTFIPSSNAGISQTVWIMRMLNFSFFDIYDRDNFAKRKVFLKIYKKISFFFLPLVDLLFFIKKKLINRI